MKTAFIARPHQLGIVFLTLLIPVLGPFVFITMLFTYFVFTNPRQRLEPLSDRERKAQWKTFYTVSLVLILAFVAVFIVFPTLLGVGLTMMK
ncbi:TPA: hypothetical protein UL936_001892 [Stenotrophomonas maltophilia]|nr:hypothetical protein [Stenotrophomonas maltophilia]